MTQAGGQLAWSTGAGWLAAAGAWWLGAPWPMAMAAAVLYAGGLLRGLPRVACLLLAPLVVAMAAPLASLYAWQGAAWAAVASLAVAPLFWALGGSLPWRALAAWPLLAATFALAWLHPWSIMLLRSDVAARAQVALVAIALLLASSALRAQRGRNR